ncbi:MAG: VCBS repeat-containing protein [Planctomycetota bacterium]
MSSLLPRVLPVPSLIRPRAIGLALAVAAAAGAARAQIQFTPTLLPVPIGGNAPFALAVGNTVAPASLEVAAAHWFMLPFFPTGTDLWSPGAGTCPVFGAAVAQTFSTAPTGFPTGVVFDVGIADTNSDGANEVHSLVMDVLAPWVENHATGTASAVPIGSIQLLAADFDGDGLTDDLLVLDGAGGIALSIGGGAFAPLPVPAPLAGHTPLRFALGSFDNDNLPDLVVTWTGPTPHATVLRNVSGTSLVAYGASAFFPATTVPGCLTVGDFDRDGADDFVVLDGSPILGGGSLSGWVCKNSRAFPWPVSTVVSPAFAPAPMPVLTGPAWSKPSAVTCGDYDRDGDIDLGYASTDGNLYFRENDGSGNFPNDLQNPEVAFASASTSVSDLETADIDRDGDLDVVSCDWSPWGACRMWCNTLPSGRCTHEFRAGLPDAGLAGVDCADPSAPLATKLGPVKAFDAAGALTLAHTFAGLPDRLCRATLTIAWNPALFATNLYLDLEAGPGNFALAYGPGAPALLVLDLERLPGGQNLLPRLSKVGRLDVGIAGIGNVDWMRLDLVSYCADGPPEPTIGYWHTDLKASGGPVTFTINAGAFFANQVAAIIIGGGVGCADLASPYEGLCLEPGFHVPALVMLDNAGDGSFTANLPVLPCHLELHSQAVAIPMTFLPPFGWSKTISDYTK